MDAVLKTQRLVLRPFEISDAPAFRSIVADPAVTRMTSSFPTQYDRLSAQGFIEIARIRTALGHAYDWAITEKDVLIGSMGLFRIGGHWEIGYASLVRLGAADWRLRPLPKLPRLSDEITQTSHSMRVSSPIIRAVAMYC